MKDAWVRGTVPAQKTTGAFLTITSSEDAKVVAASSPVAGMAQIHLSEQKGGVMQMHEIEALALPAGKAVQLKPGGNHIMLMGLTKPITASEPVPIALIIEDKKGHRTTFEFNAAVRPLG
ncbi:MAG: copper chaperone PCu(A)C, partial [Usitatibacter sp.]